MLLVYVGFGHRPRPRPKNYVWAAGQHEIGCGYRVAKWCHTEAVRTRANHTAESDRRARAYCALGMLVSAIGQILRPTQILRHYVITFGRRALWRHEIGGGIIPGWQGWQAIGRWWCKRSSELDDTRVTLAASNGQSLVEVFGAGLAAQNISSRRSTCSPLGVAGGTPSSPLLGVVIPLPKCVVQPLGGADLLVVVDM